MKKINFKKILIKNFLSVGDDPLVLDFKKGISLITGLNKDKNSKNGCGKTSIIDAFYWVIFGNTIRDIKKEKIVHNQSKDECLVELEFDIQELNNEIVNYKIERTLNPSKVHLYKMNVDTTYSTIQKTDEVIKELLGANEELFRNSIVMSLDNTLPFMAQKKIEKRKFIESILQINIFSDMLSKIRQDFNEKNKNFQILGTTFSEKHKTLSILKDQKEKNENFKKQKIENLKIKINQNEEKLKNNENKKLLDSKTKILDSIQKTEEAIQKIEEKIKNTEQSMLEISKKEAILHTEKQNIEKQINSFKNKTGVCPTCRKKLTEEDDSSIEDHIKDLSLQKEIKDNEFNRVSLKRHEVGKIKTQFLNKKIELNNINKTLIVKNNNLDSLLRENSSIEEKNKELLQNIQEILEERDYTSEKINEVLIETSDLEKIISEEQKQLSILDNSKIIVSEEGVKTYIIKKLLIILNNKLNFYLKKLEAPCTCNFDETFNEIIINENNKECSYFNFSGGERKRIDLAILFTFQDILKTQTGIFYSINVYDELFDSALDDAGTSKVIDILKENSEKYKESIYIISHNSNITKNNIDNIIELEKYNGQTKLKC